MLVAPEGGHLHQQGALGHVEVGDHAVRDVEVVRREDELVGPPVVGLQVVLRAHARFHGAHGGGAHGADALAGVLGAVHHVAGLALDDHLLGVHLVLGEVLDLHRAEGAQAHVQRHFREVDALELGALHQLAAEVQAGGGGGHGTLVLGVDGLVALRVGGLGVALDVLRQRGLAHLGDGLLELLVGAIEQEAQRAAAAGGVVDHLGHQLVVLPEVQLVADPDLAGGVHQHVPEQAVAVQFAQHEDLDLGAGLLLVAPHARGEHAGVVQHEHVALVEIVEDVAELLVLDLAGLAVQHHQAAAIAVLGGVEGYELLGEVELEGSELHGSERLTGPTKGAAKIRRSSTGRQKFRIPRPHWLSARPRRCSDQSSGPGAPSTSQGPMAVRRSPDR